MGIERDQLMLGFDMKLPQRNFSDKVMLDALGDVHQWLISVFKDRLEKRLLRDSNQGGTKGKQPLKQKKAYLTGWLCHLGNQMPQVLS